MVRKEVWRLRWKRPRPLNHERVDQRKPDHDERQCEHHLLDDGEVLQAQSHGFRLTSMRESASTATGRPGSRRPARLPLAEPDEIDVARVDMQTGGLANDEDRVGPVAGVGEQQNPAEKAEIPESLGDDARPGLFGGDPLHEEAHREQELSDQADADPDQLGGRGGEPPMNKTVQCIALTPYDLAAVGLRACAGCLFGNRRKQRPLAQPAYPHEIV